MIHWASRSVRVPAQTSRWSAFSTASPSTGSARYYPRATQRTSHLLPDTAVVIVSVGALEGPLDPPVPSHGLEAPLEILRLAAERPGEGGDGVLSDRHGARTGCRGPRRGRLRQRGPRELDALWRLCRGPLVDPGEQMEEPIGEREPDEERPQDHHPAGASELHGLPAPAALARVALDAAATRLVDGLVAPALLDVIGAGGGGTRQRFASFGSPCS